LGFSGLLPKPLSRTTSAGKRKFPDHLKMVAKKSDFLEKSDFSNLSVPKWLPRNPIRFFGKIGFLKSFGTKMAAKKSNPIFWKNRISQIFRTKMVAKKSDFLEKSDFSNLSVPPKNENQEIRWKNRISQIFRYQNGSQEIRFFGKIGFLKFRYHLKMRIKKSDFLEKSDFSNFGTT
jgi:hypothetical protein